MVDNLPTLVINKVAAKIGQGFLRKDWTSDEGIKTISKVMEFISNASYQSSASLAAEKGSSPIFDEDSGAVVFAPLMMVRTRPPPGSWPGTAPTRENKQGNPCPGNMGGKNWPPMAYNPERKVVYIPVIESCNQIDDDCDGPIDEDIGVGEAWNVGVGS